MHAQSLRDVAGTLLGLSLEISVICLKVEMVIGLLSVGIREVMNPTAGVLDCIILLVVIIHFFLNLILLGPIIISLSEHVMKRGLHEVQVTIVRKVASTTWIVKGLSWVVLECTLHDWVEQGQALVHKLRRGYLFHEDRIMDEHRGVAINKALQDPVLIGQHRDVRFDDFVGFPSHVRLIATAIIVGCLDDCGDTYGVRCGVINVG